MPGLPFCRDDVRADVRSPLNDERPQLFPPAPFNRQARRAIPHTETGEMKNHRHSARLLQKRTVWAGLGRYGSVSIQLARRTGCTALIRAIVLIIGATQISSKGTTRMSFTAYRGRLERSETLMNRRVPPLTVGALRGDRDSVS